MACLERLSRFPADERTAYLDDQIITAPTGKCAMQAGTFRYKTKMDENKAGPANRTTDRQVNCRSRHCRTHGANGLRRILGCPRTRTVRETACRRLPDREGELQQTGLRPEISGLSPVCSSLSPVRRGLSGGHAGASAAAPGRGTDGPRADGAAGPGSREIRNKTRRAAPALLREGAARLLRAERSLPTDGPDNGRRGRSAYSATVARTMRTSVMGRSSAFVSTACMASMTSSPSTTSPKTVYCPSKWGAPPVAR